MKVTCFSAVYKAREGGYFCLFPDVPNAMTQGESFNELQEMAADALRGVLDFELEKGRELPAPSDCEAVMRKTDPANGPVAFIMPVTAYLHPKTCTTCITGTDADFQQIKAAARRYGTTRSALMIKATMDYISRVERGLTEA